jgi:hypothetical protein
MRLTKKKWILADGLAHNRRLDGLLASTQASAGKAEVRRLQGRWRDVQSPAGELLSFVYRSLDATEVAAAVSREIRAVIRYSPEGWTVVRASYHRQVFLRKGAIRLAQRAIRGAIGRLILGFSEDDGPAAFQWQLSQIRVRIRYYRRDDGLLAMAEVEPEYLRLVERSMAVLAQAWPWLRFCPLCGRLYFKIKSQVYCSGACGAVAQARDWRSRGGKRTRPGRPRTRGPEDAEKAHSSWLRDRTTQRIFGAPAIRP